MYEPNVQKLLSELKPTDVVLDIGGWACPFNRANWILDAEPFETRGYYRTFGGRPYQGGEKEWFAENTWIRRDICAKEPYPFADKSIDFVICSHVLEDVRDPLWICSEMMRIAKRGYVEVPSREWETCRGLERPNEVGLSHHRWLIDISGDRIRFLMKVHMIHSHWRFSFPASHGRSMPIEKTVQWLWWDDRFSADEITIHGVPQLEQELENYVQSVRPYPSWRRTIDSSVNRIKYPIDRVIDRLGRATSAAKN